MRVALWSSTQNKIKLHLGELTFSCGSQEFFSSPLKLFSSSFKYKNKWNYLAFLNANNLGISGIASYCWYYVAEYNLSPVVWKEVGFHQVTNITLKMQFSVIILPSTLT